MEDVADRVDAQYSRAICRKWKQEVYGTSQCSKCTEREMNLQEALSELSSLQLINKPLCKRLEVITAKSEVMDEASSGIENKNVVFKNWQTSECKRYINFVGRNKRENTHIPQFSISTKNRYDVLSNPADYSLIGDELSLETDQIRLTKKLKCRDIETFQSRQNIKGCGSIPPRKENNQQVSEPTIAVDNRSEPQKNPIVMNGCV
jgi:hypothetical protein